MDDLENLNADRRSSDRDSNREAYVDELYLSNSDIPGAVLGPSLFDGNNFLNWSHGVRNALGAKNKLGFITGSCVRPARSASDHQRWIRCDYMVRCWLTNSLGPVHSRGFMYVKSAKELWDEVLERFGQSNGPLLFQLRRQMINLKQDNLSVAEYYGKLRDIWDEIQSLDGLQECTCNAFLRCTCNMLKRIVEQDNKNRVLQFLPGLNSGFEHTVNNILSTKPLSAVNKAYYLVQQVERQKIVNAPSMDVTQDSSVLSVSKHQSSSSSGSSEKKDYKRLRQEEKAKKLCTFCNMKGHLVDQCFRIVGYPDWFKGKKDSGKASVHMSEVANSPLESSFSGNASSDVNSNMLEMCCEMMKILKGKGIATGDFSGP